MNGDAVCRSQINDYLVHCSSFRSLWIILRAVSLPAFTLVPQVIEVLCCRRGFFAVLAHNTQSSTSQHPLTHWSFAFSSTRDPNEIPSVTSKAAQIIQRQKTAHGVAQTVHSFQVLSLCPASKPANFSAKNFPTSYHRFLSGSVQLFTNYNRLQTLSSTVPFQECANLNNAKCNAGRVNPDLGLRVKACSKLIIIGKSKVKWKRY